VIPENLVISQETVGPWDIVTVHHKPPARSLAVPVINVIGNSVPTSESGKRRLAEWKRQTAARTKERRGADCWNPRLHYAISIGFSFHMATHGNQPLDIENFLKPSLDALAAGLFCPNDQDPRLIRRYNYDDSNFRHVFIQRLPDAPRESEEGAAIYASAVAS
jgi:hypothetical protein